MSSEDLQPGSLVADQYEIERLIGSGGFARVYRARQLELDRPVALKVLAPRAKNDSGSDLETVKKRFYREARLISQLQAPHTVTVYEYDVLEDGKLYMALEYIDGTNLDTLLSEDAPLAPDRVIRIITQVLKALGAAHNQDVLHRDIKPTNVMVFERFGETDCVKLLDFGIAKSVMAENQLEAGLTMEGAVIGTPQYMSPEQIQGRPLTPASDLFSAGLLMYEMYTGESPFETHDVNTIYRRMKRMPEDLGPLENAPPPLADVARKLLTLSIEERYNDAGEVLADLRGREPPEQTGPPEVLEDVGGPETGAQPAEPPREAADESDAISFPLGLDRAGGTPSTELTSVSAGGQTTVAMTTSSAQSPPTPEWHTSRESQSSPANSESPVREPPSSESPPPGSTGPRDGNRTGPNQTGVTAGGTDAPVREARPNPAHATPKVSDAPSPDAAIGGRSWRTVALAGFLVVGCAVGIWYALGSGGDDGSPPDRDRGTPPVDERETARTPPAETESEPESPEPVDIEPARDRANDRIETAVDDARRGAESAAEEAASETESEEDSAAPERQRRDRRPSRSRTRDRPTRSGDDDDGERNPRPSPTPDPSSDEPADSDDQQSDDSQDPGFEVQPLE